MSDGWDWRFTDRSERQLATLDDHARDRILSKPDEVVTDQWRDPTDHLEPLAGAPHQKLRIGQFRLACRADRDRETLFVVAIRKRGGDAYRDDD